MFDIKNEPVQLPLADKLSLQEEFATGAPEV